MGMLCSRLQSNPQDRQPLQGAPSSIDSRISTFVFRLVAPRPTFALDMTDKLARSCTVRCALAAAHRRWPDGHIWTRARRHRVVGFGVVEADDENEVKLFASSDPVVTTGTADIEVGKMLAGFVRA